MKVKIFTIFLAVFLVLGLGIVSANSFSISKSNIEFIEQDSTNNFNIVPANSSNPVNISFNKPVIRDDSGNDIPISLNPSSLSEINSSEKVTVTVQPDYSKLSLEKTYTGELVVKNADNFSDNRTISLDIIQSFCDVGDVNDSDLTLDVSLENNGEGGDDEWLPLDLIEIDVELDNDMGSDLDDVIFEVALIEKDSGKDVIDEMDWISEDDEKFEIGDVDDGDKEEHTFKFKVSHELGIDENNYLLFVKAYPKGEEENTCIDYFDNYYETIDIDREDDDERKVVIDDIQTSLDQALCSEEVQLTANVYNIGDEEEYEYVKVMLYNDELDLNLEVTLEDLEREDKDTVEFSFVIPENATETTHYLKLRARYEYDDDYEPSKDIAYDEKSEWFSKTIDVEGNCIHPSEKNASISAELESEEDEIKAGEQVEIRATITNTGSKETDYTVSLEGATDFSTIESIDPSTFTLDENEDKEVIITLNLDEDVEGEEVFSIKTSFGDETVIQAVSLTVPESRFKLSKILDNFKDNKLIWSIVIINIVLIVLIILVAVKISKSN